jgi:hypothetical protein
VAGLLVAGGFMSTLDAQRPLAGPTAASPPHVSLVSRYCVSCHSERLKTGGVALEVAAAQEVSEHPDLWEKVIRKIRARQMPPIGRPRPDEATYEAAISSLEVSLDRVAAVAPNPGRTATFRRLTRTEYQNAIRDLLALEIDVAALLPADESSYGFDNITVGDLSPTLLDRYISAAEKISRVAIGRPTRSPGGDTIRIPPDLTQEEHIEGLPIGTRGGALVHYTFPLDGEYEIQIRLSRDRNEHVEGLNEPHEVEVLLELPPAEAARRLPSSLAETADADGRTLLRMRAGDLDWVARLLAGLGRQIADHDLRIARREINGQPGAILQTEDGQVVCAWSIEIAGGRVQTVRSVINPDKLRHLGPVADVWGMLRERRR